MPQDKGGRPTKLTPETERAILKALSVGLYVETACDLAGVSRECFYNWIKEGEAHQTGKHRRFSDNVKKAQAQAEGRLIGHLLQDDSWQSKAWILERKFRKRWGRNLAVENDGNLARDTADIINNMDRVEDGGTNG